MHIGAIVCVCKCDLCPLCAQDEESVTNADRRGAVDAAALHGNRRGLDGRQLHLPPQRRGVNSASYVCLSDPYHTQEPSQYADGSTGQIIRFFHL